MKIQYLTLVLLSKDCWTEEKMKRCFQMGCCLRKRKRKELQKSSLLMMMEWRKERMKTCGYWRLARLNRMKMQMKMEMLVLS